MRDIKFRAWRKTSRIMLEPHGLVDLFKYGVMVDPDNVIWMQYAELKDQNGTEIYDGYVLFGESGVFGEITGVVRISEYADNEEYMHEVHMGWNVNGIPLVDLVNDGLEVVGNIHENPELVGEQ